MLEWLTGVSRPPHDIAIDEDNNRTFAEEPPETPAPLFAVRALKSALFGTPVFKEDEEDDELQLPIVKNVSSTELINRPLSPTRTPTIGNDTLVVQKPKLAVLLSPAKGILLTPGTAATRRKTVSFGALADFNKGLTQSDSSQEGELANLISGNSSKSGRILPGDHRREAGLRRTLFDIQGKRSEFKLREGGLQAEDQTMTDPKYKADDLGCKTLTDNSDITVDLKHPLSRSGQHWKKEYQRDHEKSKKEMRKLIHYTQAAKSYAIKRDAEALSLSEKLQQALARSAEMETRVSYLASQLSHSTEQQSKNPSDQADLLNELAAQTANSLRYKQKAEKYRMAIQAQNMFAAGGKEIVQSDKSNSASGTLQAFVPQAKREIDEVQPVSFLEGEVMLQLRNIAEMAEKKRAILMKENLALKNTLARVKQEMRAYETRHQARELRRKRKDEKAEAQRVALQGELARYKVMHQQKTDDLPSQNSTDKTNGSRTTPLKASSLKQYTVVGDLNERYHQYALPQQDENSLKMVPNILERRKLCSATEASPRTKPWNGNGMKSSSLQESVDIWAASVEELKSTSPRDPSLVYDKSPLAELKHIMNEGRSRRVRNEPATAEKSEEQIVDSKPLVQVENCAVPARTMPNPQVAPASGLTLAPILASDYKEVRPQGQSVSEAVSKSLDTNSQVHPRGPFPSQSRSNTLSRILGNSRASSLTGRPPLPPDRAEAARKRLEQRNAELMRRNGNESEQRQS